MYRVTTAFGCSWDLGAVSVLFSCTAVAQSNAHSHGQHTANWRELQSPSQLGCTCGVLQESLLLSLQYRESKKVGSMSFSNEKVNTHGKKLLRPVRSCSMERAPRHYSTMTIIVQRIWLPQRVFIIVCCSSNLSNLLLSSFHPTVPEIAFHFSLCYTTVFRGKGNFISNSCLSPWPRNSCKYWVICLTSRVPVFVTVLDSKPSDKHDTTSLSCHSPHFEAQRPLQAPVNANTQATPSKHISKHMPPSWKRDHK